MIQLKMYFLTIFFILGSAVGQTNPAPPPKYMPNIQYFLRGYNIMKGNPHQTSVSAVDPGFQEPIFKLSYDKGTITPDDKYFSPDGTLVSICQACSLSAITRKIDTMNAYRDSLSEKIRISGSSGVWPWWDHRFSWSFDYKRVQTEISTFQYLYTHSHASCCAYQVQTNLYKLPPFSSDFLRGIITLPSQCATPDEMALYIKFIESFGTNYIKQMDMGSLFGQESKFKQQSWTDILTAGINIEQTSSWSLFSATENSQTAIGVSAADVNTFNSKTESQTLYTKGSQPPSDGKESTWVKEAKEYPAPIALELGSILDLFTSLRVPDEIMTCMQTALEIYASFPTLTTGPVTGSG